MVDTLYADTRKLAAALQQGHTVAPSVLMHLLHQYFEDGPFTFEPMQLRDRTNAEHLGLRVNTLGLVGLQQELQKFFVVADGLWRPNPAFFSSLP